MGNFLVNRDYIAKTSCEQRANTQSNCNGSCQLKKKIKEDAEQQEAGNSNNKQKEANLFCVHYFQFRSDNELISDCTPIVYPKAPSNRILSAFIADIFHPPSALV